MRFANLSKTFLRNANMERANLAHALMVGANLSFANLSGASLTGTDLRFAILKQTVFDFTDLSNALNLNQCNHIGPSVVKIDTLRGNKKLPVEFLSACGFTSRRRTKKRLLYR